MKRKQCWWCGASVAVTLDGRVHARHALGRKCRLRASWLAENEGRQLRLPFGKSRRRVVP